MAEALSFSLVAGEASGDLLASLLLGGMRDKWPDMHSAGSGGPRMAAQGFEPWWPYEKLAVRGYVEVLRHYREIVGIRTQLRERLLAHPPSAFIGVDAPDFNLDLERDLKAQGIPTIHFVCPSIWAWRPERVNKIRDSVDHVLCIYPFEPDLLAQHGIEGTFVGHPVADVIPLEPDRLKARLSLGLPSEAPIVALLPGSRPSEVKGLALPFLQAAQLMCQQRPELKFVLPTHELLKPMIDAAIAQTDMHSHVQVVLGRSHEVQAACDVALVASGTATLETALFKVPEVVCYKGSWISYQIAKRIITLKYISLVNLIMDEAVVTELIQDEFNTANLKKELEKLLDENHKKALLAQYDLLETKLGGIGASTKTAKFIINDLK